MEAIKNVLDIPIFPDSEENHIASVLVIVFINLFVLFFALPIAAILIINKPFPSLISVVVMELIVVTAIMLLRRGWVKIVGKMVVGGFWLILTSVSYFYGGTSNPTTYSLSVLVLVAGLLLGSRGAIVTTGLSIISVWGLFIAEGNGYLPEMFLEITPFDRAFGITFIILITVSLLSFALNRIREGYSQIFQQQEELHEMNDSIVKAYDMTLEGWAKALELRDKQTGGHSRAVIELTVELAKLMGYCEEELVDIRRGALLHDIGKMAIPDCILLKPDSLTVEEWVEMKKHVEYGYGLLREIPFLKPALDIPRFHHERWDGSGYPYGLIGEEIPMPARIFSVIDSFDAVTSDRPYRKAWPMAKARDYLKENAGTQFDERVVEIFVDQIDKYIV